MPTDAGSTSAPGRFDRYSLRWRLPAIFAAMAVLTVGAFGILAYRAARDAAIDAANTKLRSTMAELKTITELGTINQIDYLKAAAADPAVVELLSSPGRPMTDGARAALRRLQGTAESAVAVELINQDGSLRERLPESVVDPPEVFDVPADVVIGPMGRGAGGLFVLANAPVRASGVTIGAIRVTRQLGKASANRRVMTNLLGPEAVLLIGNSDGTLWYDGGVVRYPSPGTSPLRYERDGATWLSASALIANTPWLFAVELPERAALAHVRALLIPFAIAGTLIALASALVGVRVSRRITNPLAELTASTEAIARGDRDVPLAATDRRDEIGRLARAFGVMAASVSGVRQRLESEVDARTGEVTAAVERLREVHAELQRSERLASLGRLSGSIGHELRNPLGVMSNIVLLLDDLPDASPKLKDYASLLREQLRLSERIISDLLDHARSSAPVLSEVDVARLIEDLLARAAIPASVRVERRFGKLPPMLLDRDQVGQILWNLVTNAVQAMSGTEGTLTIAAACCDSRLRVEVCDSGAGVAPADVERVFEPMYTTKPQGVGLGLSISRAFARANGGDILIRPNEGPGACFVLDLPVTMVPDGPAAGAYV
jgi:signal transduction histidine kinase